MALGVSRKDLPKLNAGFVQPQRTAEDDGRTDAHGSARRGIDYLLHTLHTEARTAHNCACEMPGIRPRRSGPWQ